MPGSHPVESPAYRPVHTHCAADGMDRPQPTPDVAGAPEKKAPSPGLTEFVRVLARMAARDAFAAAGNPAP